MQSLRNVDLTSLNSLGLPCTAEVLYPVQSMDDLQQLDLELRNHSCLVLGGGSNILLPEKLKQPVIKMEMTGIKLIDKNKQRCLIEIAAGESWHRLVLWSVEQGLWGIENLALIPGTVGAAPMQNIGAYGVELADVLDWVEFFHLKTVETVRLPAKDCQFAYRQSIFKAELQSEVIITRIGLRLSRQPNPQLNYGSLKEFQKTLTKPINPKQIAEEISRIRRSKLPDPAQLSNAGSFFKNPLVSKQHYQSLQQLFPDIVAYTAGEHWKLAAGWLIEAGGYKGFKKNHVGVHDKQALVLIHFGGGSATELLELAEQIQQKVYSMFKVTLEKEVRVIEE